MAFFSFGKKDKNPKQAPEPEAKAPLAPPPIQTPPPPENVPAVKPPPPPGTMPGIKPPQPSGLIPSGGIIHGAATTQPMSIPRGPNGGIKPNRPSAPPVKSSTQRLVLSGLTGGKMTATKPMVSPGASGLINLPVGMILRCLPPDVLAGDISQFEASGAAATEVGLPLNTILNQLPSGKIEMPFQDIIANFPPGFLKPAEEIASHLPTLISLPLMDVVMRIPPDLLSLRTDQRDVDAAVANMADPFTEEALREQSRRAQGHANIVDENQVSHAEEFVPQASSTPSRSFIPPARPQTSALPATTPPAPPVTPAIPTLPTLPSQSKVMPPSGPLPPRSTVAPSLQAKMAGPSSIEDVPMSPKIAKPSASQAIQPPRPPAFRAVSEPLPPAALTPMAPPVPAASAQSGLILGRQTPVPFEPPTAPVAPIPPAISAMPEPVTPAAPAFTFTTPEPIAPAAEKPTLPPDKNADDLQRLAALAMKEIGDDLPGSVTKIETVPPETLKPEVPPFETTKPVPPAAATPGSGQIGSWLCGHREAQGCGRFHETPGPDGTRRHARSRVEPHDRPPRTFPAQHHDEGSVAASGRSSARDTVRARRFFRRGGDQPQ